MSEDEYNNHHSLLVIVIIITHSSYARARIIAYILSIQGSLK